MLVYSNAIAQYDTCTLIPMFAANALLHMHERQVRQYLHEQVAAAADADLLSRRIAFTSHSHVHNHIYYIPCVFMFAFCGRNVFVRLHFKIT